MKDSEGLSGGLADRVGKLATVLSMTGLQHSAHCIMWHSKGGLVDKQRHDTSIAEAGLHDQ